MYSKILEGSHILNSQTYKNLHQNSLPGANNIKHLFFNWESTVVFSQAAAVSSLESWLSGRQRRLQSNRHMCVLLKRILAVFWVIVDAMATLWAHLYFTVQFYSAWHLTCCPTDLSQCCAHTVAYSQTHTNTLKVHLNNSFKKISPLSYLLCHFLSFKENQTDLLGLTFLKVYTQGQTSPSFHFLLLTSAFILLSTLLTGQRCVCSLGCVCFASLSLPENSGGVLAGAQPQAGRYFVVTGTEWLGNSRASSGQPKPPAVTGSQLTPAPRAGPHGWSPGNRDVWFCLGLSFSQGRGGDWSTTGVWNRRKLVQGSEMVIIT